MNRNRLMRIFLPLTALVLLALPIISGCSTKYSIKTALKSGLGNYLVDSNGMTLYYFINDLPDKSNASATILTNWPAFYTAHINVPTNLQASDFGTITRDDGTLQTTYFGWPLYSFRGDQTAGDTTGDDANESWFVAEAGFYSVLLINNGTVGTYLADKKGMTLYYNTNDSPGTSTVSGTILANWPVFNTPNFVVPSELNSATNATISDFATITRDDGAVQATYRGYPLYYYIKDAAPGDVLGQGKGGVWYVIDPDNFLAVQQT